MLQLPPSGQPHYTVAFSPDGRWLAAGGLGSAVDFWDLHAPSLPSRRVGPFSATVIRVQFTPAGRLVLATTERAFVFEFASAGAPLSLQGDLPRSSRAVCSPDGSSLATVGAVVTTWGLRGAVPVVRRRHNIFTASDAAFTGDSRLLVASEEGITVLPESGGTGHQIPVSGCPHRIACSADGDLAAVLALGNLSVWHLPTRAAVVDRYARTHGGWLSVAFAPHGRRVVTGGIDGTVAVWDAAGSGPPLRTFQWDLGPVYAVAFDQNGQCAAAAGRAGALVWDVDD
ncbi:WD domain, G-beta repeat [Gemmata obscuriglobus]|uniref:WD40 repeat domain-containing protein n=1 Tax=Gemmata obscuriglobus TaxID=114 RepID=A0A2Z3GTI8_9BACT|nr:WD40 repeat domain-containing protein [Gemmata obscuriglobus]AWM35841.1 WD40 repeat domain-containing protein [Gemmata obscuriglobus]QEG31617.1 WD domain, G-beta repeat [Gemmata obscuriglobus]VTS10959.1 g-protein beta wd-40 repeats containing : G-protein beta WD-40 repeats containing protein, putative OS=Talaromyces stipitatus (strain ATCC 10500 / CBS 375.48 / QM 6759 / NRRL 1006) GN=TSTA_062310 PE=4 SV=1: WD40 [Gemmata obscuriglobus UQM 2246]